MMGELECVGVQVGGSPEELGAAPWVGRGGVGGWEERVRGDRRGHCSGLGALWAPFHP